MLLEESELSQVLLVQEVLEGLVVLSTRGSSISIRGSSTIRGSSISIRGSYTIRGSSISIGGPPPEYPPLPVGLPSLLAYLPQLSGLPLQFGYIPLSGDLHSLYGLLLVLSSSLLSLGYSLCVMESP